MSQEKNSPSRREFLLKSTAGLASAGVFGISESPFKPDLKTEQEKEVIYRTLGKTGFKVPVIGMGVMNTNNPELLARSYDIGIRLFDTALRYHNEEMVGDAIKAKGIRDDIILETKVPVPDYQNPGSMTPDEMNKKFLSDFDGCMERLQTDYVDVLFLHNIKFMRDVRNPGIIDALNKIKDSGRARFIGVSTHALMADVLNEAVVQKELYSVVQIAINFSMSASPRWAEKYKEMVQAIKLAADNDLGIVAMKTQAMGGRTAPVGPAHHTAALKWVLRHEGVTCAIPGYTNFNQMDENFSVVYDLEYTDEEKEYLDDNNIKYGMQFCQQCQECLDSCPKGVDVPTLMRTHMYASGYANFVQAKETLGEIKPDRGLNSCSDCSDCMAKCVNTVDIPYKINELKTLYC